MEYTLNYGGTEYVLPRYTKSVKSKMEQINKDNESNLPDEKKYKNMYLFIKESVGGEAAKEIFGTDDIDEMDLNEILVCYLLIAQAYDKPVNEVKKEMQDTISDEDRELIMAALKNSGTITAIERAVKQNKATAFRIPNR